VNVTIWGVRGSVPTPGPDTAVYGGNTSCVSIQADPRSLVVLDAGTGLCQLGHHLSGEVERIDILLTHLHMDHIIGLGFFEGFYRQNLEVHLWGPDSTVGELRERLSRYMSPPLFPVRLRELPCRLELHSLPLRAFEIPGFDVMATLVCHPGATVGYRLTGSATVAYLPDHEPALGVLDFPGPARWTSGFDLMDGVDLLIHDAQYTDHEYAARRGWGHSTIRHCIAVAEHAGVRHLVPFHHDPSHDDARVDAIYGAIEAPAGMALTPAREGLSLTL
jgi:phosphoribosyl 1,2-cyclic phosphodiesterase